MKNKFYWHLVPSQDEFDALWQKATFVFDANVMLDLYRISRAATDDFFKILNHVKDRIWIPYQAADEFFVHRESVIESEAASFDKALNAVDTWRDDLIRNGN